MKSGRNKEKTIYDFSLTGIFFWSGITVFVILLIACIAIGAFVLYYRHSDSEGIKIIPVSYTHLDVYKRKVRNCGQRG